MKKPDVNPDLNTSLRGFCVFKRKKTPNKYLYFGFNLVKQQKILQIFFQHSGLNFNKHLKVDKNTRKNKVSNILRI